MAAMVAIAAIDTERAIRTFGAVNAVFAEERPFAKWTFSAVKALAAFVAVSALFAAAATAAIATAAAVPAARVTVILVAHEPDVIRAVEALVLTIEELVVALEVDCLCHDF